MPDEEDSRNPYDEARRNFDDLNAEERARFLVEATASTLARGMLQAGELLADGLEDVIRQAGRRSGHRSENRGPGPAEPETAQRRAPRNGARDSEDES